MFTLRGHFSNIWWLFLLVGRYFTCRKRTTSLKTTTFTRRGPGDLKRISKCQDKVSKRERSNKTQDTPLTHTHIYCHFEHCNALKMYRNLPKRDLTYCHVHQSYQAIEGGLQEYRVPQTTAFDPPVILLLFIVVFWNSVPGKLSLCPFLWHYPTCRMSDFLNFLPSWTTWLLASIRL